VAVNYSSNQSQCYVRLPFTDLSGSRWVLKDLIGDTIYLKDGEDLARGLYLDEPAWKALAFSLSKA
jgi:hypothetical protein